MAGRGRYFSRLAVRITCTLALMLVAFAHKPPIASASTAPTASELVHYALPDGSLPELCLPSEADASHHDGKDFPTGCEFCRLTAAVLLPAPVDATGRPLAVDIGCIPLPTSEHHPRQILPPNASPRGPPFSVID